MEELFPELFCPRIPHVPCEAYGTFCTELLEAVDVADLSAEAGNAGLATIKLPFPEV